MHDNLPFPRSCHIYHAKSRLNTPVWGSLRSPNYFLVKNKQAKPQTHCPMCNISIKNVPVRSCPNSNLINKYLLEQMGYEGNLTNNSKVCFSCYKSQLEIIKGTSLSSTDTDLSQLITSLNSQHSDNCKVCQRCH